MRRKQTATQVDSSLIALIGGYTWEGVNFTRDQVQSLMRFFSFDPEHTSRRVESGLVKARDAHSKKKREYDAALAQGMHYARDPGKFSEEKYHEGSARFFDTGDERDVARCTSHEGLRVMAYLSRFLEPGEDPVRLVARGMAALGFEAGIDECWPEDDDSCWR